MLDSKEQSKEYAGLTVDELQEMELYKTKASSLTELARHFSDISGDSYEFLFAQLLMTISKTMGYYIDVPEFPPINARANLYVILVAPAGIFHRSTIMRNERKRSDAIDEEVRKKSLDVPKSISLMYQGSPEGLIDDMIDNDRIDFYHDEFSTVIETDASKGRYNSGTLELLDNAYYGDGYTRSLRNSKDGSKNRVVLPPGKYVTLFTGLHEDEITPKLYSIGLIRRCIIPHLSYIDLIPVKTAFEEEKGRLVRGLERALIEIISNGKSELINRSIYLEQEARGVDEYGNTEYVEVPKLGKVMIRYEEEVTEYLGNEFFNSTDRVKAEERQYLPDENLEHLMRIAINLMLYDFAKDSTTPLVVKLKHILEAKKYLSGITVSYRKEIEKVEDRDFQKRVKKLVEYVEKLCNKQIPMIRQGDVLNAVGQTWTDSDKVVSQAVKLERIGRVTVVYKKTKGVMLFPFKSTKAVYDSLDSLRTKGDLEDYFRID